VRNVGYRAESVLSQGLDPWTQLLLKDANPCMRSGETPRKRETNYEQRSAELNSFHLRGVCGEVW